MLNQIVTNTPIWVWILLVALLWIGFKQTTTRSASLKRIILMPLAMTALSLYSTVNVFGADPLNLGVWLAAASLAATGVLLQNLPAATRYNPATQCFSLPGSWVPLLLILGIFITKYAVGATTTLHPALVHGAGFSAVFCALYGGFSGVFLARAARLWRLALAAEGHGTQSAPSAMLA